MKYIYNNFFIKGNETLFYVYVLSMVAIMLIAGILVYKEIKKKK